MPVVEFHQSTHRGGRGRSCCPSCGSAARRGRSGTRAAGEDYGAAGRAQRCCTVGVCAAGEERKAAD
eukprot:scaffold21640_cov17-Tisochrysis_lutea.AAC.1